VNLVNDISSGQIHPWRMLLTRRSDPESAVYQVNLVNRGQAAAG
jgi:hypothetical protein